MAEVSICEIKYGEKNLIEKESQKNLMRIEQNQEPIECKNIGFEHNKYNKKLVNKPIYACCKKASSTTISSE